ncbi:stage III sporulation protein AF [Bacillus salitolerans]|uniref:Stage III sporulation protein AF n=1 Tax=Bacillus salitolerans TaxID=1437434 RepID=A0ABW4LMQ0_9BACI
MDFLTGWIANIILFILLAIIMDMLLPNSNLQRYVKMVTGLLLIIIILTPLLKFFSHSFEEIVATATPTSTFEKKNIENSIEFKKKEIQASHRAYILEQMAVQMKEEVEDEVKNRYGLTVVHVSIDVDESKVVDAESTEQFSVSVELSEEVTNEEDAIPAVAKVTIDTNKPIEKKSATSSREKEIVTYLANTWQLKNEQIMVAMEGGRAD